MVVAQSWLALSIGNSRLHWGWFVGQTLRETLATAHLPATEPATWMGLHHWPWSALAAAIAGEAPSDPLPELWLASVVPAQTRFWQSYPGVQILELDQIPLLQLYPTLGIDRALAVWGAGYTYGWPVLVIDAGTALTFTGADHRQQLVGGAILPGLGLQVRSLVQATAALPSVALPETLPPRWARDTTTAIQSGTVYTLLAGLVDFISAWCQEFPASRVVITGGDRVPLHRYLTTLLESTSPLRGLSHLLSDPHLIFWGIQALRDDVLVLQVH